MRLDFQERRVDDIVKYLDQSHGPGVAIGVAVGGEPVYRKGFGLANIELPVLLTPSIRLRAASVSKQFTCFAFMLLCEDGKAKVDDPIGKFLPELHSASRNVSMLQLMAHTSGIRDVYNVFDRFNESYAHHGGAAQSVKSADLLALYRDIDDVDAPPGTAWIYNNGGYLLLSTAIERIAGKSLGEMMRERIFGPIGMNDSLVLLSDAGFISNRGSQHVVSPAGGFERLYWGVDSHSGAGAVVSSIDDLLRWMAHMDEPRIGSPSTWAMMRTQQTLRNGSSTGYGLGLHLDHYRGVSTIYHNGNALGGSAQIMKIPSARLDIAILSNRQDVWAPYLTEQILDAILPELPRRNNNPRPIAEGAFRSLRTGRVIQLFGAVYSLLNEQQRQMVSIDGLDLPYEADLNGELWFTAGSADGKQGVTLVGDPARPDSIWFDDFGNRDELARLNEEDASGGPSIPGHYRCTSIDTNVEIFERDGALLMRSNGRFGSVPFRLEKLSASVWRARVMSASRVEFHGGILSFENKGTGFSFSHYEMRGLHFRR